MLRLKFISAVALLLWAAGCFANTELVIKGKAVSRIVVDSKNEIDNSAAVLLQDLVCRISGAKIPIVSSSTGKKGDVIIATKEKIDGVTHDGFVISSSKGGLNINGVDGKGTIYAVVTIAEKYLGMNYWGKNEYSLTKSNNVVLPDINIVENPSFRYRQSQCYALEDPIYRLWNKLDEPKDVFAGEYWVHTFDRLLPSDLYGKTNPEYYSYYNGRRHPGKASQWCLTNDELFEEVAKRIDSVFAANPTKHIISVSQNDGNNTNCKCDKCRQMDSLEGSPSGSLIYFLNKLAERRPDKEFSTLAYLYTMHPPKNIKPLPNVNIMLCDIDCKREVSLTENASGRDFMKAIDGWSKISNNIFVWDYGINFDNYLAPFPNFHILKDNINIFKEHNATMHFSQIASIKGGDFAELRAYMVSQLMWNHKADADSLMRVFINGYYGAAAPHMEKYIAMNTGALLGSGLDLWIYDSPVSHKNGMLKPELVRRYDQLYDQAESSVKDDTTLLRRVQRSRLQLQFSKLELARTDRSTDTEEINRQLNLFERRVKELDVNYLNERNNTPLDYCRLYRERYMPRKGKNLASGAKIEFLVAPGKKYRDIASEALTDGLFGGTTYVESWIGWMGTDASFIIDLGQQMEFNSISTDFLHQLGAWILLPRGVKYSLSNDGKDFTTVYDQSFEQDKSVEVKFVPIDYKSPTKVAARYIRVDVKGDKECPPWHYGVGQPCWFFIDEITVQ